MTSDAWGSLTTASELGKREGWYIAPSRGRAGREEGGGEARGGNKGKRREDGCLALPTVWSSGREVTWRRVQGGRKAIGSLSPWDRRREGWK